MLGKLFTPEEIAESDLRVSIIREWVKARHEKGISQKKSEELSGIKQPVIARMEKGSSIPHLDTILKVLVPIGKTLAVVSLESVGKLHIASSIGVWGVPNKHSEPPLAVKRGSGYPKGYPDPLLA